MLFIIVGCLQRKLKEVNKHIGNFIGTREVTKIKVINTKYSNEGTLFAKSFLHFINYLRIKKIRERNLPKEAVSAGTDYHLSILERLKCCQYEA